MNIVRCGRARLKAVRGLSVVKENGWSCCRQKEEFAVRRAWSDSAFHGLFRRQIILREDVMMMLLLFNMYTIYNYLKYNNKLN